MKRILSIVCIAATAWLLTACGTAIQLPRSSGNVLNGGNKTYTFYNLPEALKDLQALPEANMKTIHSQAIKYKTLWTEGYGILPDADGESYHGEKIMD